jgi:hypothetical protein
VIRRHIDDEYFKQYFSWKKVEGKRTMSIYSSKNSKKFEHFINKYDRYRKIVIEPVGIFKNMKINKTAKKITDGKIKVKYVSENYNRELPLAIESMQGNYNFQDYKFLKQFQKIVNDVYQSGNAYMINNDMEIKSKFKYTTVKQKEFFDKLTKRILLKKKHGDEKYKFDFPMPGELERIEDPHDPEHESIWNTHPNVFKRKYHISSMEKEIELEYIKEVGENYINEEDEDEEDEEFEFLEDFYENFVDDEEGLYKLDQFDQMEIDEAEPEEKLLYQSFTENPITKYVNSRHFLEKKKKEKKRKDPYASKNDDKHIFI